MSNEDADPSAQNNPYAPPYAASALNGGCWTGAGGAPPPPGFVAVHGLGTVRLASIGQRFLARVIDLGLVVVVVVVFASLVIQNSTRIDPETGVKEWLSDGALMRIYLVFVLLPGLLLLYEWIFISFKGQTLGKMVAGVKVVLEESGEVPGWVLSFVRTIIPAAASYVCLPLGPICYLSVFFDGSGRQRAWYDMAVRDVVISTAREK